MKMKKICLLLSLALLLGFNGIAQKNQTGLKRLATSKTTKLANTNFKHSSKQLSTARLNYQNPVIDISKGLKSSKSIIKVLILTPDYAYTNLLVTDLSAYPDLQVTVLDTNYFETLSVAALTPYDVVFAYNDTQWEGAGGNRTVVGNVLKDYLDAGGKVVENEFLKSYDGWGIAGGYVTGNYSAFGTTTDDIWTETSLGTILDPLHPIMTDVSTLTNTFGNQNPTLAAGATEIADWANGEIAIAVKPNVVSINMLPADPNIEAGDPVYGFTGDGITLYHNAIVWLVGAPIAHCDISPLQIISPLNSDALTSSDSIKVKVANNDSLDHYNIPISYVIDGGSIVTDTITDIISGGSFIVFTFKQPYNFSAPQHIFNVEIYTSYACDTVNTNDTLSTTIFNDYDASSLSIDMDSIIGNGNVIPLATVKNNGSINISFDVTINIGAYTSTKSVTNLAPNTSRQITFDTWNAANGNYIIEAYTQLVNDMDRANDTLTQDIIVMNFKKVYCYSATSPEGPAYTYLQNPATIVSLADQSLKNFIAAGAWGLGNKWYGSVYTDNTLITIDTVTGARTVIGNIGINITGLSYDYTTYNLYGIGWNGSNSSLYSISTANGNATLIGACSNKLLINLACDTIGNLYSISITNDSLYSVNKNTGVATGIGALGFNAAYAQDMEFDHATNICYAAAFDYYSYGKLMTVNLTTGAATLIGAFADSAEITGFAIPYSSNAIVKDAGVASIISPSNDTSCVLTSSENIKVVIANIGTSPISNFNVSYKINSGTVITETVTSTIPPFSSLTYTFSTTENLSAIGSYTISAYTSVTGDVNNSNDTVKKTVFNTGASITINIQTDDYGNETTWELINNTTSMVVATGGPYAGNHPQIYSTNVCVFPSDCYTFRIYDDAGDGTCCDFGNGSYEVIWNSNSFGIIPGEFEDSASINNICAPYAIDLGVISITEPVSACFLSATEDVSVTIKNLGANSVSNFQISYKLNNGVPVTSTITSTLASGASMNYTFTGANAANLSSVGNYTIKAYTTVGSDGNNLNDTTSATVSNVSSSNIPYSMGFEPSEVFAGWTIENTNNDAQTWAIETTGGHAGPYVAIYKYNSASAANDWLITKCIELESGKTYHVSYWYKVGLNTFPERFNVFIGSDHISTSLTTLIKDQPNDTNKTYKQGGANFTIPANGVYYIGFHCYSAADMDYLYIDDISITDVTDINEVTNADKISVYPNPAKDVINVFASEKIRRIKVMNAFGQVIISDEVNNSNITVNTTNIANGMYYLQIETNNGLVTKNINICK